MQLTPDEIARIRALLAQPPREYYAPAPPPAPPARPRASFTMSFATLLVVVVALALATERIMPGSVSLPLSLLVARAFPEATVALNGTPVAPLPTALVTAAPVREVPVIQRVEVPVPAPPVIIIASPTPVPAGVSVSADQNGVTLAVSNGAPAPAAAPPPPPPTELPRPGEPGFVESFKSAPTLAPSNPFIGCLPGHNCGP